MEDREGSPRVKNPGESSGERERESGERERDRKGSSRVENPSGSSGEREMKDREGSSRIEYPSRSSIPALSEASFFHRKISNSLKLNNNINFF